MRLTLQQWIADAETLGNLADFGIEKQLDELDYLSNRSIDLYFSLVGELFNRIKSMPEDSPSWAALGNAFASLSRTLGGSTRADALFFSATSFYCGGYPASAVMTMRLTAESPWQGVYQVSYDLLSRRGNPTSETVRRLVAAVREGDQAYIEQAVMNAEVQTREALLEGPEQWVAYRLYTALVSKFQQVNLRAVLPDGWNQRWNPLVESFLIRPQPAWDFFPSQIEAIKAGLLTSKETYSLQMPTGAGKTALTETLLFNHLTDSPETKAVLLVPYRALARELRYTVGRNLTRMGLQTRTVYGGTVPTNEEGEGLHTVRIIIATPESLTGLLGAHPELASEISLVVCDEGHLLDTESRGVHLELLLARLRTQGTRMVFLSAIVPNIEDINAWLGGTDSTVVRSHYRPALTEYAVLQQSGSGRRLTVALEFQEFSTSVPAHTLPDLIRVADFKFTNPNTGRINTYPYDSKKTQAVAVARKSLSLGTVAVFGAAKTGAQGVIGLASELVAQVDKGLPLPLPGSYIHNTELISDVIEYLTSEYGADWTGTRALEVGAIVHHGDLPQETREIFEELLSGHQVRMVFCTTTLAEGVNLPIRTLVLYSVSRGSSSGPTPMLARDIKNLVGRAGRAGSSTRGLVVCISPEQWNSVKPVAAGEPGESVEGALIDLLRRLAAGIRRQPTLITNSALEATPDLLPLIDGIDAMLMELIHDELGADEFRRIAESLASDTFAARQADEEQRLLLDQVFRLRASRIAEIRSSGRLSLVEGTGGRLRLVDTVIEDLYPRYEGWSTVSNVLDSQLIGHLLGWAGEQPGFSKAVTTAYDRTDIEDTASSLHQLVVAWIEGQTFSEMSRLTGLDMDKLLNIHTRIVHYELATLIEQAIALLQSYLLASDKDPLSSTVLKFPELLRYGVPTMAAHVLMAQGMRHRQAAIALGTTEELAAIEGDPIRSRPLAYELLTGEATWLTRLGRLVYQRSLQDTWTQRSE